MRPTKEKVCGMCPKTFDAPSPYTAVYCPECRPKRKKQREAEWNQTNLEKNRDKKRAYAASRKESGAHEAMRFAAMLKQYGLTEETYEVLCRQFPVCPVCDTTDNLVIDHDHTTGHVRGRLCRTHNAAIGQLGDSIEGLQRALQYLAQARLRVAS